MTVKFVSNECVAKGKLINCILRPHPHVSKQRFHSENGRNVMFSVHTTLQEFNIAAIISQFGFVCEENSVREIL